MIPLAKWLRDENAPPETAFLSGFPELSAAEESGAAERHQLELEEAYQRGRADGAAERDAIHAAALVDHEARAAARDFEITREWSEKFSGQLAGAIADSAAAMRREIEAALESVLSAFLEDDLGRKIAVSLVQIIDGEIAAGGRLPLEISAPEPLHEQIRAQCELRGLSLSLTDSPGIKVVFRDGLLRYDDMSKQWTDAIRGMAS